MLLLKNENNLHVSSYFQVLLFVMLFGLPMGLEEQMSNHNTKGSLFITAQPKQVEVVVYPYSKRKRTSLTKEARKA